MLKPPTSWRWITTLRATRSRFPLQKNLKIMEFSSPRTQGGMCTKEATYQILDRARALITSALPQYDRDRERHEERQFSTASIRGRQLAASTLSFPMNTPKILSFEEDHSIGTGASTRSRQAPSQRPLRLSIFNFAPVPASKRAYVSKTATVAASDEEITDVSSAYRDKTGSGTGARGREMPLMEGWARMLTARTSIVNTYKRGGRGQPCLTPRDGLR